MPDFFPLQHRPSLFGGAAWRSAWQKAWADSPAIKKLGRAEIERPDNCCRTYRYTKKINPLLSLQTAFPEGISTPSSPSIRCEYFNAEHLDACMAHAIQEPWDQYFIPDVLVGSKDLSDVYRVAQKYGLSVYQKDTDASYGIDTASRDFQLYVASLSKSTQTKLFKRRKNLLEMGEVNLVNIWPDEEKFYQLLNGFHIERWGKPCYDGRNRVFISALLHNLAQEGCAIDFSLMSLNDKPVSVVLDIVCNKRKYNLQMGYVEKFSKKISLGTLHFGYQIEQAFSNESVDFYDFLAGRGKNNDYKKSLATANAQLVSLLLVRRPLLKIMYRLRSVIAK